MAPTTSEIVSTGERMIPDAWWTDEAGDWRWVDSVWHARTAHPPEMLLVSLRNILVHWSRADRMTKGDTVVQSLANAFVSRVVGLPEVERVFWKVEHSYIRVWTVMDRPSVATEDQIYDAQLDLMDAFPELSFDFVVIFRQGQREDEISPEGATEVFARK